MRPTPRFWPWWKSEPATRDAPASARRLNAAGEEPTDAEFAEDLARPDGARVFHPVTRAVDLARLPVAPAPIPAHACRVCGAGEGFRTHAAREMMFGFRDPFTYGECGRCGCVQLLDPPADLARYYGPGYYSFGADLDVEFADPALREARGRAVRDLLTLPDAQARAVAHADMRRPLWSLRPLDLKPDSRVLDVGCGSGRLLHQLRTAGYGGGLGADLFLPQEVRYANGLRVLKAGLADLGGGWDVIMLHHAFEHLPDPARALADAAARLKPGGRLLLRLPLADSEAWRIYGADWVQLDCPRHFFLHTRASLAVLAAGAGLEIERVDCDSYELQFWGSEQYRRDIALHDEGSHWGGRPGPFGPERMAAWRARSAELNAQGRCDQGAVYLRKPG